MADDINDDDIDLLGQLGVEAAPAAGGRSAAEQRIIAGFEEIGRFVEEHGRLPQHGEDSDIFERLYAVRLGRIRESAECRAILSDRDPHGLLGPETEPRELRIEETQEDESLLSELGVPVEPGNDLAKLVHVRAREEIKAAEEVAQRDACADFGVFKPLFENIQKQLDSGERRTIPYRDNADTKQGDLFILDGQKVIVANMGEKFTNDYGRPDRRLRVVYDNGTESNLLLRSLQRALNKDKASRRIIEPELGPLFSDHTEEGDVATGTIYVLRSKSDHPFIAQNRNVLHKIGVTGGDVGSRIANAKKDPTYLLADVEVVATFKLSNIARGKLESLLHKFFGGARLDLELKDRFGGQVEPREWFLVPLPVIEEVIEKIKGGSILNCRYDTQTASIITAHSA